jgi:tetratricopeptide (TPR) repeat protein
LGNLANTYKALGRFDVALALEESRLDLFRRVLAEDDSKIGISMNNLAASYTHLGRHDDALAMEESALEFRRRILPASHPAIGTSMSNLAGTYSALGRHDDALAMMESALEFRRRVLPPSHPDIALSMNRLAATYTHLGRHDNALAINESALEFRRRVLPPNHPDIGTSMNRLALTYTHLGRHDDALAMEERVLEFHRRVLPASHPDIALSLYNISLSYERAGDLSRAMECACEALRIWRAALPPEHEDVVDAEKHVHRIEGAIQELALAAQDSSAHATAAERMQIAGSVVVTRHRGGGCAAFDYTLHFRRSFNTFVADIRLCGGCFYWELEGVDIEADDDGEAIPVQFGVCSEGFEAREDAGGEGAGDDAWSWAVDGIRQLKWHEGDECAHGSAWDVGDVIGFAVDMRTAGAAVMSVSVNGSFAAPNGPAFTAINAPYLLPALTGQGGRYRLNLGDRPFAHSPPNDGEFVSVHAFHRQQQRHE